MSTYHVTKCNHQPLRIFSFSRCLGNGSESYVFIRQFPPRSLLCLISSQQKKIFRCSHQERLHIGFQGDRLIFFRGGRMKGQSAGSFISLLAPLCFKGCAMTAKSKKETCNSWFHGIVSIRQNAKKCVP